MDHNQVLTAGERRCILAVVCVLAYALSLWMMGASWWKAPSIALLFAMLFLAGWGARWIERGAVGILVVGSLVWLGALPPPTQWQPIAATAVASLIRG